MRQERTRSVRYHLGSLAKTDSTSSKHGRCRVFSSMKFFTSVFVTIISFIVATLSSTLEISPRILSFHCEAFLL